jgi:predicted FMN-binding regulatory protein PaiB
LGQKYDGNFDIANNVNEHQNLVAGIVGIEITITHIFAKFKLAQSKNEYERINVIKHLEKSFSQSEQMIAKAMKKTLG